jgi:hemerythrin-like domain-containing protein
MTSSATATHDGPGQLRLPGQAAAHDGPVDLTVMYVVHAAFRRDLAAFSAAAAHTPVEDRDTWRALADRWTLFSTVLHHHHAGEDAGLWPLLLERVDAAGDAEGRATLTAMEAEHAEIDPLLAACESGFRRLAATADDDVRAALAVRLVATREHLGRHLRHEETDALRLVQEHLTRADWERLDKEHFKAAYSFRETLQLVGWVLHGLPAPVVARLRRDPDTRPLVLLGRLLVCRRFDRRERAAFRYVP